MSNINNAITEKRFKERREIITDIKDISDVDLMQSFINRPNTYQSGRIYSHGVIDYV